MEKQMLTEIFGDKFSNTVSTIVAGLGVVANYLYGGWTVAMGSLVFFMVVDFVLGMACGKNRQELSSARAYDGIFKKISILLLVAVAYRVDIITGANGLVINAATFFYLGQEGLSIIENAAVLGAPIPDGLKKSLVQLSEGHKKQIKEEKVEE